MDDCQRAVPVVTGGHVIIEGWGLGFITSNATDFLTFLQFATDVMRGELDLSATLSVPHQQMYTLERLIQASLVNPADASRIRGADLPALLEAIIDVNAIYELVTKLIGLRLTHHQVLTQATPTPNLTP